ncbi:MULTISPECIES: helix-turn-helix domain-containing protein [Nocardia]|uniref:helix-turn-helix domain-containing protein n=1 Tax=Nocardia TaxID=1817 RepID=UPI0007A4C009|nr:MULTISPECIES: helix-turn-helix transcriptional regulator [Nocardia]
MIRGLLFREPDLAKSLIKAELDFRKNLVAARQASDLTREQVAEKLGTTAAWVRDIEDPTFQPTLAQLRAYMLAINVSVTYHIHI